MTARDIWAVVPVKRLAHAKMRLSGVLSPAERVRLAEAMLCDVLGALASVRLSGALVVTADPDVAAIARGRGAAVLAEAHEDGINAAVKLGLAHLERKKSSGVIVLPADVPLVSRHGIERVLAALDEAPLVLVPAHWDGGTNLIAARPPGLLLPEFGGSSFARHLRTARARGIEARVLHLDGIGRDIDRPGDLAEHAGAGVTTLTADFLRSLDRANRLAPARRPAVVPHHA